MKNMKTFLIKKGALLSMLLGLIFIFAGFSIAGFDVHAMQTVEHEPFLKQENTISAKDITRIQIDSYQSEISLLPSADDQIHLQYEENDEYPVEMTTDSSTMKLKRTSHWIGFQWFDFESNEKIKIVVQIPKQYQGTIELANSYGTISLQNLNMLKQITIENEQGDIALEQINASSLDIEATYGDISMHEVTASQDITITSEHGAVISKKDQFASMYLESAYGTLLFDDMTIDGKLTIENEHTKVKLGKIKAKDISIDQEYGDVQGDNLQIAGNLEISNDNADVTIHQLTAHDVYWNGSYGDLTIALATLKNMKVESYQGTIQAIIKGSIEDFHITSNVANGESNLPPTYNEKAQQLMQVEIEYGDINVTFQR